MSQKKRLRGAVVGAGYFSQFHCDGWQRISEVDLVAVCDTQVEKAELLARRFDIPNAIADPTELIQRQELDFIDIVTRPDSHLELVRKFTSAGVDVICQKPLAPTLAEAQQLVKVAEQSGKRLMVHENFRFQPWHRRLKHAIIEGLVGDHLHSINCRTRLGDGWQPDAYVSRQPYFREMPQLLVFETGVHFIDTFRFLMGEISGVYADLRKLNSEIAGEDTGTILFEFANGARGLWDATRFHESNAEDSRYTFGEFHIEGNRGVLRVDEEGSIFHKPLGQPEVQIEYAHEHRNFAGDCVYTTQLHFADCLLRGLPFETSGLEYLKTLAVQQAVYESAMSRQPVRGIGDS